MARAQATVPPPSTSVYTALPPPPSPEHSLSDSDNKESTCCDEFIAHNGHNFECSDAPMRIMFYLNKRWEDFKGEVLESLITGFSGGKPILPLLHIEGSTYAFDFQRMLQVHLGSGHCRSIAWVDQKGKPFFPVRFLDHDFSQDCPEDVPFLVQVHNQTREVAGENDRGKIQHEEEEVFVGATAADRKGREKFECEEEEEEILTSRFPNAKPLMKRDKAYVYFNSLFMSNMTKFDCNAAVKAIHEFETSGVHGRAWWDAFEKQIDEARGKANVVYAWYAAPPDTVASIFTNGFELLQNPPVLRPSLGAGIFLADLESPHFSGMQYPVDRKEPEKHLILCRVVLGSVEKVGLEFHQTCPSRQGYDTGSDNPSNPRWYVVWASDMNTRIVPVCVVTCNTFAILPVEWKMLGFESDVIPRMVFEMKKRIPFVNVPLLDAIYDDLKSGRVSRYDFMKQLRVLTGDELMENTAHELFNWEEI